MKKGFTLLELIVVIIILGILATLGLAQYLRMVEKSRGAEARQIIGAIRTEAAAIYMQNNNSCANCTQAGLITGVYPGTAACGLGYYFWYTAAPLAGNTGVLITATRCLGGNGKQPGATGVAGTIVDTADFAAGTDALVPSAQY